MTLQVLQNVLLDYYRIFQNHQIRAASSNRSSVSEKTAEAWPESQASRGVEGVGKHGRARGCATLTVFGYESEMAPLGACEELST